MSYFSNSRGWKNVPASYSDGYLHARVEHFSQWAVTVTPPETRPTTVPNVLTDDLAEVQSGERWYSSGWLGDFNDAGNGWIFHLQHGWLYPLEDGAGNYWLYHGSLGWLWTGSEIYDVEKDRRFLYSHTLDSWLFYDELGKNFHVYRDSSRIDHRGLEVSAGSR